MVDAVFCMVAILIILIVTLPREPSKIGFFPQADAVLTCKGESILQLSLVVAAPGAEARTEPLGRRIAERVGQMRSSLDTVLEGRGLAIAHVRLIAAGPAFLACHDAFHCAFPQLGQCLIPGVSPPEPGSSRVSYRLTYAETTPND
jgi:hypothetical protein